MNNFLQHKTIVTLLMPRQPNANNSASAPSPLPRTASSLPRRTKYAEPSGPRENNVLLRARARSDSISPKRRTDIPKGGRTSLSPPKSPTWPRQGRLPNYLGGKGDHPRTEVCLLPTRGNLLPLSGAGLRLPPKGKTRHRAPPKDASGDRAANSPSSFG